MPEERHARRSLASATVHILVWVVLGVFLVAAIAFAVTWLSPEHGIRATSLVALT
jgi:uncharacterized membrane protein